MVKTLASRVVGQNRRAVYATVGHLTISNYKESNMSIGAIIIIIGAIGCLSVAIAAIVGIVFVFVSAKDKTNHN